MKILKKAASKIIPSAIVVDFEKNAGNHSIQEVAPYPSFIYMAAPRTFSSMNTGIRGQQLAAWEGLKKFEKPFLSLIGLKDHLLGRPSIQKKFIENVPGAKGQNHEQFENANHFIQEDIGEIMADRTHQFILKNPL